MEETLDQVKQLHAIEDVEQAIFYLERGMPAHPRVIGTLKMLCRVMANEYNNAYAPKPQEPVGEVVGASNE